MSVPVSLNGEPHTFPAGATLADAVAAAVPAAASASAASGPGAGPGSGRGVAAAVNEAVVPRSAWPGTRLAAGDRVEILTAVQGG